MRHVKPANKTLFVLCWLPVIAQAGMQSLSDEALSSVAGRDGITVSANATQLDVDQAIWENDGNTLTFGDGTQGLINNPGSSDPYNNNTNPFSATLTVDAGTMGGTNPLPFIGLSAIIPEHRLYLNDMRVTGQPAGTSIGELAMEFGATLDYSGPLFSDTQNLGLTQLSFDMTPGQVFYRQGGAGTPELGINNFELDLALNNANINADSSDGLIIDAPTATVKFIGDYLYDPNGASPFSISGSDRPVLRTGWQGGLTDLYLALNGGGAWSGGDAALSSNRTEGLNLALQWNFDPATFEWVVGESDDPNTAALGPSVLFDDWQPMHAAGPSFSIPNLTVDLLNGGASPSGLCWLGPINNGTCSGGGNLVSVPAETGALAILLRDAHLGAYSSGVTVRDDVNGDGVYQNNGIAGSDGNDEIWSRDYGLIYTLGDVDGNIYLYPGKGIADSFLAGATDEGLKLDLVLKSQSRAQDTGDKDADGDTTEIIGPDVSTDEAYKDFTYGTHFMIADTDPSVGLAVGFHSADFLLAADDLYISALNSGLALEVGTAARIGFKGRFGGGPFPDVSSDPVKGFDLDINLGLGEGSTVTFNGAPPGQQYLAYAGTLDITDLDGAIAQSSASDAADDGSYISLAEPGRPNVDLRAARINGRLAIENGRLDVISTTDTPSNTPAKLQISHDLVFGSTAGGDPLLIDRVEFGDSNLGKVAIPSGRWHARMALKCQTTSGTCN